MDITGFYAADYVTLASYNYPYQRKKKNFKKEKEKGKQPEK